MAEKQNQDVIVPHVAPIKPEGNDGFTTCKKRASILGTLQITMGIVLIGLNTGSAVMDHDKSWIIGTGWWGGVIYIVAGSFGIFTGCRPNRCNVIATMVMSIIACVTIVIIIMHFLVGLFAENNHSIGYLALKYLLFIFGVFEFFFALAQSILWGSQVCYCRCYTL